MSEVKPYVMTYKGGAGSDVDQETRIVIHGPFSTEEEACDWANDTNVDDDPRWALVMLSNENIEDKTLFVPILSAA